MRYFFECCYSFSSIISTPHGSSVSAVFLDIVLPDNSSVPDISAQTAGNPYCNCNCQGLLMGKDEVRSGNCYQAGLQHGFSFADFLSEHRSVSSRHRSCWLQGRFHFPKNRGIIRPSSNFQWHCESSASASTSHC